MSRLVEVRANVLKHNDVLARSLRERFHQCGVYVISLVSGPGSGKTTLLETTLSRLRNHCRIATLVGDLATERDAVRLQRTETPVRQITTGTVCHLDAAMVDQALAGWELNQIDCLFIENVGNLVCPSSYDLGEETRVVLLSVTEGEDKPLKYPAIFNTADAAVITKVDLAAVVECDLTAAHNNIQSIRPGLQVFEVSAKTGQGMDRWLEFLRSHLGSERLSN